MEIFQAEHCTNGTTTWTFTYNADGIRTKRTDGTTTYVYAYNGSTLTQLDVGTNRLFFVYDGTSPTAVVYNGTTYYYQANLQGDIIALLNSSGTKVVEYTYDAWGNILSTTGTLASTLGVLNPLRYRGYVYDTETGLYYLQSRYYNPEWGRFINPDAFPSTGQGFTGNNMFAYCGNNPVIRFDPTGTCFKVLGIVLFDCHQSTCLDSRYYNAKRIAVIYDARQSGILQGRLLGQGFKHQGGELVKRLGRSNYVESHPFYDAEGFMDSWNSLSGEYDEIYLICHSEYGNLYFIKGAVSVSGKKYQYSQLQTVDVDEIFLYCCNGATISETGNSVAMSFHGITGATVHAIRDGKIGFTWYQCYPYPTEGGTWTTIPGR